MYTHTHTHTCIYIYKCIYVYVCMMRANEAKKFLHLYVYIHTHTNTWWGRMAKNYYTYMYTHKHTHAYIYLYMYLCVCMHDAGGWGKQLNAGVCVSNTHVCIYSYTYDSYTCGCTGGQDIHILIYSYTYTHIRSVVQVAKNGEICVNTLKKDWKADCKLSHILMVVRCLLIEPNPESALNEEAGRMFMEVCVVCVFVCVCIHTHTYTHVTRGWSYVHGGVFVCLHLCVCMCI